MSQDATHAIDFVITKASVGPDGRKRWAATVSKFMVDEQDDEVTSEMYERSIAKIANGEHPMPALVVSHYDDPRAEMAYSEVPKEFRAGTTEALYIDGSTPKAKGHFEDTPLGNATYEAVKSDIDNNLPHEKRIRISMAWRPEGGGVEKAHDGHNVHRKALIRHLAITRVPIIKETNIMVAKSNASRTKFEDALTIVGEDLAEVLDANYRELMTHNKSAASSDTLIMKAKDSEEDSGKDKFSMGECLTMKVKGGMDKKEALKICLKMSRGSKKPAMDKVPDESEEKEKAYLELINQIEKRNSDDEDMPITRDMLPCIKDWRRKGVTLKVARTICLSIAKKKHRGEVTAQAFGKSQSEDEEESPDNSDDCVSKYMEDGMSRKDAKEKCASDKAKNESASEDEEAAEKAYLDDIIDKMVDYILEEDSEVQIVNKSDDSTLAELLLEALLASPAVASAPESVTVETGVVNAVTGESNGAGDVNEAPEKSRASVSPELKEFDDYYNLLKSAMTDDNLDQNEKAMLFNHVLGEMSSTAETYISKSTPASPQDMAVMLREALSEAMGPVLVQNQMLIEAINASQQEKAQLENSARVPQPRQLRYTGEQREKAEVSNDNGGALTAAQVAEQSVRVSGRMY